VENMTFRTAIFFVLFWNLIAVITAVAIFEYNGDNHFKEKGFVTIFSIIQLLTISLLAYKIFTIRRIDRNLWVLKHSSIVWLIISTGFLFLAADEYFMIHENLDFFIHYIFNIRETGLTDRIDDTIIGIYGLIGIGVLFYYRNELKAYKEAHSFFIYGFILLLFTVILDGLTNREDMLQLFFDQSYVSILKAWLSHLEESLKIYAEASFILAFYSIYLNARQTKQTANKSMQSTT